jgi:hypothetical protein
MDVMVAIATGIAGSVIVATNQPPPCDSTPDGCFLDFSPMARGFGYGLLGWSALSAISSIWGFSTVGQCREAIHDDSTPPPPVGRLDPVCLRERAERLRRAQQITDVEIRTEALLSIPECEPMPVDARPSVAPAAQPAFTPSDAQHY